MKGTNYRIQSDTLFSTDNQEKQIPLDGASSVMVEITAGACYLDDVLPMRSESTDDGGRLIYVRRFDCPEGGVFAPNTHIRVSTYKNKPFSLIITAIKPKEEC